MRRLVVAAALMAVVGCKESEQPKLAPRDGKLGAQRCSGQPSPNAKLMPVFQRPFDRQYPVAALFDHDLPKREENKVFEKMLESKDVELTYCGLEALGLAEGSPGYTYLMPIGTHVLAPADGVVVAAGVVPAFACPLTRHTADDQLNVQVRHEGLGGVGFLTSYSHLSKLEVAVGDKVVAGQLLGLSGKTGCATEPLLSFVVKRLKTKSGQPTVVDPYGWDGPKRDPWADDEAGAESTYLWKTGEAPTLRAPPSN